MSRSIRICMAPWTRFPAIRSLLIMTWVFCSVPVRGQDADPDNSDGQYVYIRNPINTDVVNRVKTQVRRFLDPGSHQGVKIVFDFNPQGYPSHTSDYASCQAL